MADRPPDLRECPFCGGAAEFVPYKRDGLTIRCATFGCVRRDQRALRLPLDILRKRMIDAWNRRAREIDAATINPSDSDSTLIVPSAECWRRAFTSERAAAYRAQGMKIEQARIHAETDADLCAIELAREGK